jgi:SAM-dependent methyltransferase
MGDREIKLLVQDFYNQVGWKEVSAGTYQNATYEDLRPVSHEYVHRCHLRVLRHLQPKGFFLLDAGSGPIQYPEYLEYSRGYHKRICLDISSVALQEARQRIGEHGSFVVGDIAKLPFKTNAFDGLVSLHTIHHLPENEHLCAYQELQRVLAPNRTGVIVNGWDLPPLTVVQNFLVRLVETFRKHPSPSPHSPCSITQKPVRGTYIQKHTSAWLENGVGKHMSLEIWCWRCVSVHFMRTFIHARLGGQFLLRILYWLEERFPHFFGKNGQYPLIVIHKKP